MKRLMQVIPVQPGYRRPSMVAAAAPVVTSIAPDEGSEAGGTSVTITGTGFVDGATVQFGLVPAENVSWVDANTITCTTPARPATEVKDVRVTNPDGSFGVLEDGFEFAVGSVLNPATLTLNGWLKNFASSPWTGTASAGASGSRSIEAGSAPSAGTLNSLGTADFVSASSNYLFDATNLADAYLDPTAYRVVMLVNLTSVAADAGSYFNPGLLAEGGGIWGIVYNDLGVHCYHYDGAYQYASSAAAVATGSWHLIDVQYDGTYLTVSVDGVAGTPVAAGALDSVAAVLRMGANYAPAVYADARIAELLIGADNLAATSAADFVGYVNNEYALSL